MQQFLYADHLTFSYENSIGPLFNNISLQLQQGWTGIVGANGIGKSTLLKLFSDLLQADSGSIRYNGPAYYCEQRTDFIPSGFKELISATNKSAFRIKNSLDIKDDWLQRWYVLSHGERKRCQIATALFLNPAVLAIDEPSNHLDQSSKTILFNALQDYHGIGVLVSHDRELLDDLCRHTLFVYKNRIDLRRCNYSTAVQEIEKEKAAQQHNYQITKKEIRKIKSQVTKQKEKADQAAKMKSKRGIRRHDHDAKAKIDAARLTGKDAVAGRTYKKLQNQLEHKYQQQSHNGFNKSITLGISFNIEKVRKRFPVTIGHDKINLGNDSTLSFPDLLLQYSEKIGLTGNNGSGKSTLINYMLKKMNIPANEIIYIPQEIPLEQSKEIVNRIQHYNNEKKGDLMTIINRLNSDAKRVLETTIPSPGEIRKLLLAEGIMLNPGLIIMDEPTNHMDLPSIQCVEQALSICHCTQLLVSHDLQFLKNIVHYYWAFEENNDGNYSLRITDRLL